MTARREVTVPEPLGGWPDPWPQLFELADHLPTGQWSLVGGLMTQLHARHRGVSAIRPTSDLDIVLHIEIDPNYAYSCDRVLKGLGYVLQEPAWPNSPSYRYRRGTDTVDVMVADHAAPRTRRRLAGQPMFPVAGGTQALRRTMWFVLHHGSARYRVSAPDEFGALVLKGAAYITDNRDTERHLHDAAWGHLPLAGGFASCIGDLPAAMGSITGSDRKRIRTLQNAMADPSHPAWLALPLDRRTAGQDTLRILATPRP